MNCQQVHKSLSDYSDGLLDPEKTEAIREHLTGCEPCRSQCQTFQTMLNGLHTLPPISPSSHFNTTLREKLAAIDEKRSLRGRWNWLAFQHWLLVPTAVSLALLLAVGSYLAYNSLWQPAVTDSPTEIHEQVAQGERDDPIRASDLRPQNPASRFSEVLLPESVYPGGSTNYVLYTVSYEQPGATIGF